MVELGAILYKKSRTFERMVHVFKLGRNTNFFNLAYYLFLQRLLWKGMNILRLILWMCVCKCVCVYMCIYIYMYVYICICICMCVCLYIYKISCRNVVGYCIAKTYCQCRVGSVYFTF